MAAQEFDDAIIGYSTHTGDQIELVRGVEALHFRFHFGELP